MSRLRRVEDELWGDKAKRDALAVVNDGVAAVEAHQPAARRVEFNDDAYICREECPAPELKIVPLGQTVLEGVCAQRV
jgi:hypothetical protein